MSSTGECPTSTVPEVTLVFWILKILATTFRPFLYWFTIIASTTVGTTLADFADSAGLGYEGAAILFGGLLLLVVLAYFFTRVSRTLLFWIAFVLTRPLGAVVGDFIDKPVEHGGLAMSRYAASAVLIGLIVVGVLVSRQRPAARVH